MALLPPPGLGSHQPAFPPPTAPPISPHLAHFILTHREYQGEPSNLSYLVHQLLDASLRATTEDPSLTIGQLTTTFIDALPRRSTFSVREQVLLPLLDERIRELIQSCETGSQPDAPSKPSDLVCIEQSSSDQLQVFLPFVLAACAIDAPYRHPPSDQPDPSSDPFTPHLVSLLSAINSALASPTTHPSTLLYATRTVLFSILSSSSVAPSVEGGWTNTSGASYRDILLSHVPGEVLRECSAAVERWVRGKNKLDSPRGRQGETILPSEHSVVQAREDASSIRTPKWSMTKATAPHGKSRDSDLPWLLSEAASRTLSMSEQRRLRQSMLSHHSKEEVVEMLKEPVLRYVIGWNGLLALSLVEHVVRSIERERIDVATKTSKESGSSRSDGNLIEEMLGQLSSLESSRRSYDFLSRLMGLGTSCSSDPTTSSTSTSWDPSKPSSLRNLLQTSILPTFLSNSLSHLQKLEDGFRVEALKDRGIQTDPSTDLGGGEGGREVDWEVERVVNREMWRFVEDFAVFVGGAIGRGYLRAGGGGGGGERSGGLDDGQGKDEGATTTSGEEEVEDGREPREMEPLWIIYELKAWSLRHARVREAGRVFSLLC